jgi:hypothetical protein
LKNLVGDKPLLAKLRETFDEQSKVVKFQMPKGFTESDNPSPNPRRKPRAKAS